MARTRIVIVIHDTVVQGVYCSDADAELVVVDWDVERCNPTVGIVAIAEGHGLVRHAHVYQLSALPFQQLPGSHTYEAIQQAGMSNDVLRCFVEVAVPESLHPHSAM
jgi:hypothetical protein